MPRYATSRQKACKPCMVAKTKCDKKPGRCARCSLRGLQCAYAKQNGFPGDAKNGHSVGKDIPATSYGGPEVLGPSSTDESQPKPYAEPSTASITAHTAAPAPTTQETPQASHPSTRVPHRDSNAASSRALKTPPTAKPTPTNDLYCPIDADAIQNRWLKFYLSEPGQNQKHYTANVTTFISRMLNSYVSILIRGTGIPPFLHKSHISTTSASMPALSICLTLLHTCHSSQPHDSPSLVTTIQSEMLRLSAEHLTHPDAPLFAAFQAHLIYCMLLFFHFPALSKLFRRQAMMDLQTLACASSRGGLVCVADKTGTVPEWESWVLAEAKRRTLYTMYLFDSLLSAEEGTPTLLGTELKGLPAPAERGIWGAGTRGEWEVAFGQWSAEGEEILRIEELWPLPVETERGEMEVREARVQRWLEDVDEFGTMLYAVTCCTHGV